MANHGGYDSGHPWYYKLGGAVLTPAQIMAEVEANDNGRGDETLIEKLDRMKEPRRSAEIHRVIAAWEAGQDSNIERYHEVAANVRYERERPGPYDWDKRRMWEDPITGLSLKHNHISYYHGTLMMLRRLVSVQLELF